MRITLTSAVAASLLALTASQAPARPLGSARYQGRSPEQSETFSRKVKVSRDGHVSVSNVSGDIVVTAGSGDAVSIDAIKRGRGDRRELDRVNIIVDEHPGRVEVRTEYPSSRTDGISVDYMVTVPAGVSLDVYSTSGNTRVTGVKGSLRLTSVSGSITTSSTPRVEYVRSVSGGVDLADVSHDGTLSITSVSGHIHVAGIKARVLEVTTVSGGIALREATCDRLNVRSVSGSVEYDGALTKNGRYEVNSQSGGTRFSLAGGIGFELNANSFSGSVRSDYPAPVTLDRRGGRGPSRDGLHAVFGDGSASLNIRTFSGDIAILKTTNK